jgi:CRISPR/Cas system-associated exonuclease Cas4 (RecB family)
LVEKQQIYDALRESSSPRSVNLGNLISEACSHKTFLDLAGEVGDDDADILLEEIARNMQKTIKKYLTGCFPGFIAEDSFLWGDLITVDVAGFLGNAVVDIVPLSNRVYTNHIYQRGRLPTWLRISAATKAHFTGMEEALVITIDRNNQKWSAWRVSANLEAAAGWSETQLEKQEREAGGAHVGIQKRCSTCPYKTVCTVSEFEGPETIPRALVTVKPDLAVIQKLESYLRSLNQEDNGRSTKCIHPSSFAISPCDREIAYDLVGTRQVRSIAPHLRRIFDAGHAVHDALQKAMHLADPDFRDEVKVRHDGLHIKGSCDGVLGEVGYEIKSIGEKGFDKLGSAKADHKRQATLYAAILELKEVVYLYANKERGELLTFSNPLNLQTWHRMAARAERIIRTVEGGGMPPKNKCGRCSMCSYEWTCKPEKEDG